MEKGTVPFSTFLFTFYYKGGVFAGGAEDAAGYGGEYQERHEEEDDGVDPPADGGYLGKML